jgi:hypothetical protein
LEVQCVKIRPNPDEGKRMSNESEKTLGIGVDIGTMNFVSARNEGEAEGVRIRRVRDAFIDLETEAKKSLKMSNVSFYEEEDSGQLLVLGDSALQMANLFKREIRRPLAKGLISPGELREQRVLSRLLFHVLGEPMAKEEHCYYSVPAEPIDLQDQDVVFHTELFRRIIEEHGYTAHPMNEAMAVVYSQCPDTGFSGLSVSFGAGLCNVALAYQTMEGFSFSIARGGGDWIDTHSAKALGVTAARMCAIKEKGGFSLSSPPTNNREAEALSLYVRSLIRHCLERIAEKVRKERTGDDLFDAIPLVVSGGTTLATGFLDVFQEEFETVRKKGFPIPISEVRPARDPMTAVAEGLLVLAMQEHSPD